MGNLLGIVVHAANIHDTKSGILAAQKACKSIRQFKPFAPMQVIAARVLTKLINSSGAGWKSPRKSSLMSGKNFRGAGLSNVPLLG